MSSIADNIGSVTRRIQKATMNAGRDTASVRLLAVSKTRPASDLREAWQAGQAAFGESYLQEALDKMEALNDLPSIEWHFIGPVQSNKTRQIAAAFDWVHSVDRLKIARRLSDQRGTDQPPLNICLQVNINHEASKAGCLPDQLPELVAEVGQLPNLSLRGLMAIPDPAQSEQALQQSFQALAALMNKCRHDIPHAGPMDTLSMGMSGDLEPAIAAGATIVRVGSDIFGRRPAKS